MLTELGCDLWYLIYHQNGIVNSLQILVDVSPSSGWWGNNIVPLV